MARTFQDSTTMIIEGPEAGPTSCYCDYVVQDVDLQEPSANFTDPAPDFTMTVSDMGAATVTAAKAQAGL